MLCIHIFVFSTIHTSIACSAIQKPIVYEQVQGSLGQSNLISISLPWVKVSQGNLVRPPSPSTTSLPQSLVFISPLFDQTMTPIPHPTTLTTYFHAIQLPSKAKGGGWGMGEEEHWLKKKRLI